LPSYIGKSKLQSFNSIKDKVQQRLNNWKVKFLSQAGKEILLKAVLQAIPTYIMCVFLLPVSLCKELQGMMQRFWWGHMAKESNVHWMSWERMGRSKMMGGLGFRDLLMFNKALLAKQGWRILQNPDSLIATVLKAKYFKNGSFMEAEVGARPSFVWRSLTSSRDLLQEGLLWRIGDGKSVNIWKDRWLPTPISFSVMSPIRVLPDTATVLRLFDPRLGGWNCNFIKDIFHQDEAEVIASIPLSPSYPPDRLTWLGTTDGLFTVRSAYHMGMEIQARSHGSTSREASGQRVWSCIWSLPVQNQVKIFL
jgi:hypothetical protein